MATLHALDKAVEAKAVLVRNNRAPSGLLFHPFLLSNDKPHEPHDVMADQQNQAQGTFHAMEEA